MSTKPSAASVWRLTRSEQQRYQDDGYVLRHEVFDADEVAAIVVACEELIDDLVRDRHGMRLAMGSYVFEPDFTQDVTIKWEGDSDVVHGVEPCAHLSPPLHDFAYDRRMVEPMQDLVGDDAPMLFTEKLNLKRPQHGGENPAHQDYPYWADVADDATRVATAMLFLDDATIENGCLQVAPGSHRAGVWATRTDGDFFAHNEIDRDLGRSTPMVPLEVPAGSVVFFGPYLVHRSAPNRSSAERRSLLYSYQPAGSTHMIEKFRALAPSRRT